MGLFPKSSNSTAPTKLLGYRAQTSIYGQGLTIVLGTNRVSGNVFMVTDWTATPVKSGGKSGGKGSGKNGGGQYNYSATFQIGLAQGQCRALLGVWQDKTQITDYPTFINGARGQSPWSYLSSNHPEYALGYSEVALACFRNINLGTGGTISNYSFELTGLLPYDTLSWLDALATDAMYFLLTNYNCANFPTSAIGDMTEIQTYCRANGIGISPVIDQQQQNSEYLKEWLLIANSEAFSSEGLIKFRTYGDKAVTGNGVTFSPNLAPIYDLGLDDFITTPGQPPITFTLDAVQDRDNHMSVEWTNRGRQYNLETMADEDAWAIQQYGRNIASPITIHSVCNADVAQQVLSVRLKRSVYMLRKCQFVLGWKYSRLEPMDIVSVPEQYPSTARLAVRLLTADENENGDMTWTAEVLPFPILAPTIHPKQNTGGYTPGFNAQPGATNPPIFFEATPEMLNQNLVTQLTLFLALSGGPSWGGCSIWLSTDGGNTYAFTGTRQTARATMGFLTADLPYGTDPDSTHTLSVNLQESLGALSSASAADYANLKSLAVIDHEVIDYENVTLTGANSYNLTNLRRGVFGSIDTTHKSGAAFFALDGNQAELPYQPGDIGKTWYLKFTSFNLAGQNEQSLSDVAPYPFTLTAPYVRGPLALKPYGQSYLFAPHGSGPALAQVNGGASIQIYGAQPVNQFSQSITAPLIDFVATVTAQPGNFFPVGSGVAQVFGVDSNGNYSPGSNLTEFDVTNTASRVSFNTNFSAGTSKYEVFVGEDLDHLIGQGIQSGAPTSISLDSYTTQGYGPPDARAVAFHARGKRVIHGGIALATVVSASVGSGTSNDSIVIGIPSAPTADEFAGRYLILVSKNGLPATQVFSVIPIAGNDSGIPGQAQCTIYVPHAASSVVSALDLVLISTKATAVTATSITDSGWVSPFAPGGLATDAEIGNIVRLLYDPTGAGVPGDAQMVTGNTSTGTSVTPWQKTPGLGSVFIVEEPTWRTNAATTARPNAVAPTLSGYGSQPLAAVPTTELMGYVALIEILAQDQNGIDSAEIGDGLRMMYVLPQGPAGASIDQGYYTITPAAGVATIDLANGLNQRIVLGASAVSIPAPVYTNGAINAGLSFTLYLDQDATGNRAAPTFAGGTGAFVSNTADYVQPDGTANTRTALIFTFHGTHWSIDSAVTGIATS